MTDKLRSAAVNIIDNHEYDCCHCEMCEREPEPISVQLARAVLAMLDPPDDVREAMRREMEKAIESASSGLHDSQGWWDDYYSDIYGKPLIEVLLDNLEKVMKRHYIKLTEPSE